MKKVTIVLSFLAVIAVSCNAFGVEWYQNSSSTSWNTPGNWTGYAVPTLSSPVHISEYFAGAGKASVVIDAPANCATMNLGYYGNGTLDIQSSLTIAPGQLYYAGIGTGTGTTNMNSAAGSITTPYMVLGYNDKGMLNMSAGSINAANYLLVGLAGTGQITMSGGTITADQFYLTGGDYPSGKATVDLSGGTIYTNYLSIGIGTAALTFSGSGKLVLDTSVYMPVSEYLPFIDSWMGTKILNAQYEVKGNLIEFTTIPEPITLVILGLGGLLMRRKNA